jgi:tetratricopeptide (TPR) repeat protein
MGQSDQALVDSAYKKIEAGDYNEARHDFREAIGVTPRGALEYVNRGLAYNGLGITTRPLRTTTKLLRLTRILSYRFFRFTRQPVAVKLMPVFTP